MSRLIDADDLIIEILTHDLIGDDKEIDKIILDAPTVKAIPVEFIERKLAEHWYVDYDIRELLDDWEKENQSLE